VIVPPIEMSYQSVPNIAETQRNCFASASLTDVDSDDEKLTGIMSSSAKTGTSRRPLSLLVIPFLLVLGTAAILVAMIVWLITSQRRPLSASTSLTRAALIVDETSRWCKIQKTFSGSTGCDDALKPSLLGLTLSGLLVCIPFYFRS
jgi:hypothetical protein